MRLLTSEQKRYVEQVLVDESYIPQLEQLVLDVRRNCADAKNEASVVYVFDTRLFVYLRDNFKIDYHPNKEVGIDTERHIARAKMDSKVGALIIEYKQPSKLKIRSDIDKATRQISEYLEGLYKEKEADYVGFITDGTKGRFVEMRHGKTLIGPLTTLSTYHLDKLIKSIVLLDKLALTSDNLIDSFCKPTSSSLVSRTVKILFETIQNESTPKTKMLFNEWKELFKLAHDDVSQQRAILERSAALSQSIGHKLESNEEEYQALYSLQSAYAIIVKIIAYKVACNAKYDDNFFTFSSYSEVPASLLREQMQRLEDGAVFRDIGIGNLLEGDFFSWYSDVEQWNEKIAKCVSSIFEVLSSYEDIAIFGSKDKTQDLFRELYLHIMPDKVRYSLGEFYTPTWLAEQVVSSALIKAGNPRNWTGMDPCAGSGTFLNVMIQKVLDETHGLSEGQILNAVLGRVKGIDLNPLAVLTSRVNYFINISGLLDRDTNLEIPVYLGDASYVPTVVDISGTKLYEYTINTLQKPLNIRLPASIVIKRRKFSTAMTKIEGYIKSYDEKEIVAELTKLLDESERTKASIDSIKKLASDFVDLEKNNWNGIWARIVTNFLTTASLDKVDILVGNPPWIDWKTLPTGYRERIKSLCISRHLFSGDRITGGINLNICALICNVASQKWMEQKGVVAFLMPKPLLFQQSYEGFRNLTMDNEDKLFFEEIHDWTKSGHPFKPVQQEFLTYFISRKPQNYNKGINVVNYVKKAGPPLSVYSEISSFKDIENIFDIKKSLAIQSNGGSTAFSYTQNSLQVSAFKKVAGTSEYKGREGIEFYPQELFLLERVDGDPGRGLMLLQNYQNGRSKHKIASEKIMLEKGVLHPLIKGVDIFRFHISGVRYIVPFPYKETNTRIPTEFDALTKEFPLLAKYLTRYKKVLQSQTSYNDRIIGKKMAEFYALARVGAYTFAPYHVAYRDNSKWQAAVVSATDNWFGLERPLFQNHAASISQRPDGRSISHTEAHYICAIMNAPIIRQFIIQSSDSRTFKINPPFKIPLYAGSKIQKELAELSIRAHAEYDNQKSIEKIDALLNSKYLQLLND